MASTTSGQKNGVLVGSVKNLEKLALIPSYPSNRVETIKRQNAIKVCPFFSDNVTGNSFDSDSVEYKNEINCCETNAHTSKLSLRSSSESLKNCSFASDVVENLAEDDNLSNHRNIVAGFGRTLSKSIGETFRTWKESTESPPESESWFRSQHSSINLSDYMDRTLSAVNSPDLSGKVLPSQRCKSIVTPEPTKTEPERDRSIEKFSRPRLETQISITSKPSVNEDVVRFSNLSKTSMHSLESGEETKEESKEKKPKIPDGGWGWVVVFSSLVISMIADGISFSFGLLYIEFLNHYGQSKSKTSWIGSLFMAVPLLLGPVGSALVDKYGCRAMTMLGGIISGTGFILSSISTSIEQQFLTFGLIAGCGLGLCYMTAVVSIAYWFDKKRTLATSLGACGTGIGTFVYAPMTTFFIEAYGWRGAILLLAGTFFNMCVCGAIMRDPEWWVQEQNKMNKLSRSTKCSSTTSISGKSDSDFPGVEEIRRMLKSGQTQEYIMTEMTTSTTEKKFNISPIPEEKPLLSVSHPYSSVVNIPTFVKQREKVPFEVLESLSNKKRVFNVILENYPSLLMCRSISDHGSLHQLGSSSRIPVTMSLKVKPTKRTRYLSHASESVQSYDGQTKNGGVVSPEEILYKGPPVRLESDGNEGSNPKLKRQMIVKDYTHHYLKDIRIHRNSLMHRGAMLNIHKYHLRASSCPNIYRNSITTIAKDTGSKKCCREWMDMFDGILDFSMFLEFHFLLLSLATILLFTWFIVPYFYLSDFVINRGMSDAEASSLLSVIGVTNTFGMIFLGWAGDQPWMNVTKTYAACLCACGISAGLMPLFIDNYWALFATSASFGMFFASNYSFTPTILVELIPLNRFTTAYGLILLCQGIGNLLGPPLAGWVFDVMNVWDYSFYLTGFWIVVSGILMGIIPITKNRLIWGTGSLEKEKEASGS